MMSEEIAAFLKAQHKFNTDISEQMLKIVDGCQELDNKIEELRDEIQELKREK